MPAVAPEEIKGEEKTDAADVPVEKSVHEVDEEHAQDEVAVPVKPAVDTTVQQECVQEQGSCNIMFVLAQVDEEDAITAAKESFASIKKAIGIEEEVSLSCAVHLVCCASVCNDGGQVSPVDGIWFDLFKTNPKTKVRENNGRVLLSVEIMPKAMAEKIPAGLGRKEPNQNPFLPPPSGRLKLVRLCDISHCCYSSLLCASAVPEPVQDVFSDLWPGHVFPHLLLLHHPCTAGRLHLLGALLECGHSGVQLDPASLRLGHFLRYPGIHVCADVAHCCQVLQTAHEDDGRIRKEDGHRGCDTRQRRLCNSSFQRYGMRAANRHSVRIDRLHVLQVVQVQPKHRLSVNAKVRIAHYVYRALTYMCGHTRRGKR